MKRTTSPFWWATPAAAGLIVLCTLAAYRNSFSGPFIYDDIGAIAENPTIRQLWPLWRVLTPPRDGETVSGRPLLNLSLAVNYALGGLDVWGYHATNLAIHVAAALLLFGIVRRTLLRPTLRGRFAAAAVPLALTAAVLWALHPLNTESVTYIIQRAESLVGLCYLLTLYCVIRGAGSGSVFWYVAAVLACLVGMACKEVMITAPLVVLLYDYTFLSGSLGEAWRRRWALYLGLAATWGLLAYLVITTGLVPRQPEMGAPGLWSYVGTQPGVILHYLALAFWPAPLCLDYEWPLARGFAEIALPALVVGLLLGATVWGLVRRKAWGFLGACFFLILAPTSSVFPLGELAYEHRTYLSLGAIIILTITGAYTLWDRLTAWLERGPLAGSVEFAGSRCIPKGTISFFAGRAAGRRPISPDEKGDSPRRSQVRWAVPVVLWGAAIPILGYLTVVRNRDYQSPLTIWSDTVEKHPNSSFAHNNLGMALHAAGRPEAAIQQYEEALHIKPRYAQARCNLGISLAVTGRFSEAVEQFNEALRVWPENPEIHSNLGTALSSLGKTDEAIQHYRKALELRNDYAEAHNDLGNALASSGRLTEAIEHYREALRLKPDYADAHKYLANALTAGRQIDEAIQHYHEALRLKPDDAGAHNDLGIALHAAGRTAEAISEYRAALRIKPNLTQAHNNLGWALWAFGRTQEAIEQYQRALKITPDDPVAHYSLANILAKLGRTSEAVDQFRQALQIAPDDATSHYNFGNVLAQLGRSQEAIEQYGLALKITPDWTAALNNLAWLLATREATAGGDAARAIELAERAIRRSGPENVPCLDTLAAAYAAAGRGDEAVKTAERAIQLATAAGQTALAEKVRSRLELYRAGRPYRQPRPAPGPTVP